MIQEFYVGDTVVFLRDDCGLKKGQIMVITKVVDQTINYETYGPCARILMKEISTGCEFTWIMPKDGTYVEFLSMALRPKPVSEEEAACADCLPSVEDLQDFMFGK